MDSGQEVAASRG
jgi:hypothetical protein